MTTSQNHNFDLEREAIKHALEQLGEPCRELLMAYYIDRLSIEEIKHHLKFDKKNKLYNKKWRCKNCLIKKMYAYIKEHKKMISHN